MTFPEINARAVGPGEWRVHYYSAPDQWPYFPAASWGVNSEEELLKVLGNLVGQAGRVVFEKMPSAEIVTLEPAR